MTTPTVPSFRQTTRKIGRKGAANQRGHLILHTNTTNEEPMPTVRLIVSSVKPYAKKQKKRKGKGKTDNANLFVRLARRSVSAEQPKKGRIKARRNHDAGDSLVSAINLPQSNETKRKTEGTPCPWQIKNKKEEPTPTVRSIVSSVEPNAFESKKVRKRKGKEKTN